jgi:hypothetical protein
MGMGNGLPHPYAARARRLLGLHRQHRVPFPLQHISIRAWSSQSSGDDAGGMIRVGVAHACLASPERREVVGRWTSKLPAKLLSGERAWH